MADAAYGRAWRARHPGYRKPGPVDWAVVDRLAAGERYAGASRAERRAALERLVSWGLTHRQIAARLGMTLDAADRAANRARRRAAA